MGLVFLDEATAHRAYLHVAAEIAPYRNLRKVAHAVGIHVHMGIHASDGATELVALSHGIHRQRAELCLLRHIFGNHNLVAGKTARSQDDFLRLHVYDFVGLGVDEANANDGSFGIDDEVGRFAVQLDRGAFVLETVDKRRKNRGHVADAVQRKQHGRGSPRVFIGLKRLELRAVIGLNAVRPLGLAQIDVLLILHVVGLALFLKNGSILFPLLFDAALDAGSFLHFRTGNIHNAARHEAFAAIGIALVGEHDLVARLDWIHRSGKAGDASADNQHVGFFGEFNRSKADDGVAGIAAFGGAACKRAARHKNCAGCQSTFQKITTIKRSIHSSLLGTLRRFPASLSQSWLFRPESEPYKMDCFTVVPVQDKENAYFHPICRRGHRARIRNGTCAMD